VSNTVHTDRRFTIEDIIADVRARGDVALTEWSNLLDKTEGPQPRRAEPYGDVPTAAVMAAAQNIRTWHAAQRPSDLVLEVAPGVTLERRWTPLRSVGVYVPTNLISSLMMGVIPAQEAGVERIVVCTPPKGAGLVAATAKLLGVDEVWAIGGAQAIAAMAFGTESIAPVDKIVGPGNQYVNDVKLEVWRDVPIDLPGGPSEVVVVAGEGANPRIVELEIAAQAEHGHDAGCTGVSTREEAETIAPEHLVLLGSAEADASLVRNAGAVFVGDYSPVASGDYATGGNHVLPTGGWSKSTGGLGLEAFMKTVTVQRVTKEGLERLAPTIEALAEVEGMIAHKATARR